MFKPLWSYLPVGSYIYEMKGNNTKSQSLFSAMFHSVYGLSSILYVALAISTGSLNPVKQHEIFQQRKAEAQQKKDHYFELSNKIFGPKGFADTNKDGIVSIVEMMEAYQKIDANQGFPYLTEEQLEKLAKTYEGGN